MSLDLLTDAIDAEPGSPSGLEQAACASAMVSRTAGAAAAQACSDWGWSSARRACSSAAPYRLPARHCCSGLSGSPGCGCRGSCMSQCSLARPEVTVRICNSASASLTPYLMWNIDQQKHHVPPMHGDRA